MNQKFKIATLSDNNRLGDPTAIILGGVQLIQSLFPNFLGSTEPLSDAELNNLFPGSGFWAVQLKQYLKSRTRYKKDMQYWYPGNFGAGGSYSRGYIAQFVLENRAQICPDVASECWSGTVCQQCMSKFSQLLQTEQFSGSNQFPGYQAGFDLTKILLYGGAAVLVLAVINKRKRSKK